MKTYDWPSLSSRSWDRGSRATSIRVTALSPSGSKSVLHRTPESTYWTRKGRRWLTVPILSTTSCRWEPSKSMRLLVRSTRLKLTFQSLRAWSMVWTSKSTLTRDQMLRWLRTRKWSCKETAMSTIGLMSSLPLCRAWRPSTTPLRWRSEARTLTWRLLTIQTRHWWTETLTWSQSMRRFRSTPPFWPSKTRTYRESWTLSLRLTTSFEEIWTERRKWSTFATTWTLRSRRAWTRSPGADLLQSRASRDRANTHHNFRLTSIDQRASTMSSRRLDHKTEEEVPSGRNE